MIENKKIFITGGAGFIGSKLASVLCESNDIVLFDNLKRNTIQYTNLLEHKNISLIKGNILDETVLCKSMEKSDIVIHAAAIAGIDSVIKNPIETLEVNTIGTANVLRAAHHNQVPHRLIDISTSEVFGSMAYNVDENAQMISGTAGESRWTYAVSKLAAEHLTHAYFTQHNLPVVCVRPFNIYGPGQTGEGAIQIFVKRAMQNEDIVIYGDGSQIRAWCYIDDFIEAIMAILVDDNAIGQCFNIGNSRAVTTIYTLAKTVIRILDSKSKILFKDKLSADIELRIPETQKSQSMLGIKAKTELEEGIIKTAEWYKKHFI